MHVYRDEVFESRRQIFVRRSTLHPSKNSGEMLEDEDPEGKVRFTEPMLALAVTKLPGGGAWSYELELETINQDKRLPREAASGLRGHWNAHRIDSSRDR
jgi:hypothetical protein